MIYLLHKIYQKNLERKNDMHTYKAHLNEQTGEVQTVREHSYNTADLCREYAIPVLKDFMYVMGLLHDVGKYQASFQRRIEGANIKVEHSGCGALAVKEAGYPNIVSLMMEYCIMGHHSGIPDGGHKCDTEDMSTLCGRLKRRYENFEDYKNELVIPPVDTEKIVRFLARDCGEDPARLIDKFAFMTRYCFSCLTDADSVDTALFCGNLSAGTLTSDFKACLAKADRRLDAFVCVTGLQKARALLQRQVFDKIHTDAEIYLMNMPTGSGKTLCSVKFALEKAVQNKKKRIIYIIPYNSIIDQTVQVFEDLFGEDAEILRHQSTFSYEDEGDESKTEDYKRIAKSATENWNVNSVIITTAVQFFESVYANKRGKLRKLHNMADSILIFDEAHLMPLNFLQPCLQAVAYITKYLNSQAIFLTATMPDFHKWIRTYALENSKIIDLIEDKTCFSEFQKCDYRYLGEQEDEEILEKTLSCPSSLIIVNTRQAARKLFQKCGGRKYHLSTYMTSVDRKKVIDEVRSELRKLEEDFPEFENVPEDRRMTIVSTSLIEAGVDMDVFTVFRELAGLDSILQAGGRCNREGKRKHANVYVFERNDGKKKIQDIKSNLTKGIFDKYSDISCQESIQEYYERLQKISRDDIQSYTVSKDCPNISCIPFSEYADSFELIDSRTVSIVVPRDEESRTLVDSLKSGGGVGIARRLQKYSCTLYQRELDELFRQHVAEDFGTGIWCLTNTDYYDEQTGILFEASDYFL